MPRTTGKKSKTKTGAKKAKPVAQTAHSGATQPVVEATGYPVGTLVSHPQFGEGTVMAIDADKLTIKFDDGRVKQIVDYYVKRRER
jgi:hypothetical protein